MATILFAWELGANLGHLSRDLPLVRACRAAGHKVVYAAVNLRAAAAMLEGEGVALVQAPALKSNIPRHTAPVNFPDMLLHEGYDDEAGLHAALTGWEGLIDLMQPSLLIYNHAPTALIAAHCRRIPTLIVGTGFEVPPPVSPQPSFRPWQDIPQTILADAERTAVAQINRQLTRRRMAPITQFAELFANQSARAGIFLTTFPELDHFGPRRHGRYIGPLYGLNEAHRAEWRSQPPQRRVFAYLRLGMPRCEQMLDALQQCDAEVVCVIPDAPPEWSSRYGRLRICTEPLDLSELLPSADGVIAYGAGSIATALLAGVPVLLLPQLAEQYIAGLALEKTGAGIMLRDQNTASLLAGLRELLNVESFRRTAALFAERHAQFNKEQACLFLMQAVEAEMETSVVRSNEPGPDQASSLP